MHRTAPLLAIVLTACAEAFGQTDGFRDRLAAGCSTAANCEQLVVAARARVRDCAENEMGKVRCADARADVDRAGDMYEAARDRERAQQEAAEIGASKRKADQRNAEEIERKAEVAAREAAAWAALDLDGCASQSVPTACEAVREYLGEFQRGGHAEAAHKALRDSQDVVTAKARAEAEVDAQVRAAQEAKEEAEARKRRPAPSGGGSRARCCDGTLSPKCPCGGGRGCCSRHGGVCGCG